MDQALFYHRFHFAFTASYHYIFPQLTMGLALLIVLLKATGLRTGDPRYDRAAHFWGKIFGLTFVMGVVTGIPMEFQFGTNWARFSEASGGVIGQTLAMEGVFAFFLESSFLALFLFGRDKLSPKGHFAAAVAVWVGSWASGFFIVATNAWMQHPVGYELDEQGRMILANLGTLLSNPWLIWQYIHTMAGAVVTGSFTMSAIGAYYILVDPSHAGEIEGESDAAYGRLFLSTAVPTGLLASILIAFPTGDMQAGSVARHQPPTFAAMEGLFQTGEPAGLVLIGQPDMKALHLDNPLEVPAALSFLTYRRWDARVEGLTSFPRENWPDNVPLLYYAYHIMVGLGTMFIAVMGLSAFMLWRRKLSHTRPALWLLMLAAPFPFIANTTGWMTAELGRQPWLVWGVLRTSEGTSHTVQAGNALFSLIGFMGLYLVLGILYLFLAQREIAHGPAPAPAHVHGEV